jgi:2-polyprenyl-3-methyl-5-hydroxy-6-metoxy-1,4-benzoquinol methylase
VSEDGKDALTKITRKLRRAVTRDDPEYYDMFENKGERFFGRLYLHEIFRALNGLKLFPPLKILDAGCQSGRIAIPLAKAGHKVTGVDTSLVGLTRARRHAQAESVKLKLVRADIGKWLTLQPAEGFDAVICTEVLYQRPNYKAIIEGIARILKPGGLCFISHRPADYYIAEALQRRDWEGVRTVLSNNEGALFDSSYYNWQNREELEGLYAASGIEALSISPIGCFSWLAIDPAVLNPEQQELLFQAEIDPKRRGNTGGRYLLFSGRKKKAE